MRWWAIRIIFWIACAVVGFTLGSATANAYDGCEPEPITPNTPTGIAGCEVWGDGIASHYGPGTGVAMNWCTWEVHAGHTRPCGWVTIQSHQTGITVTVPVVDFCDCWLGDNDPGNDRIVDLQYGVVDALGLNWEAGLYEVTVWREQVGPVATPQPGSGGSSTALPDTAVGSGLGPAHGMATGDSGSPIARSVLTGSRGRCSVANLRPI